MDKNIYGYNGIVEYKIKKGISKKMKVIIFALICMILTLISFIATIIILNKINYSNNYENQNQNESIYTNDDFINAIKDKAIENYDNYGVLPSITIAQAILESSYGNSTLASKYNNLFGIKANEGYNGETISFETNEEYDEVIVAAFRVYDSFNNSIEDHGKFLKENMRYTEFGLFKGRNYKDQAQSLENAGYATVKDEDGNKIYAELLIEVIEENNLNMYD